jgi:phosphohistidine phosphatase
MNLYLLRHADANTVADTDDERPLSEKGEAQAQKVGRFCEAHGIEVSLILTSPVRRARETATIFAEVTKAPLEVVPWLACGAHPEIVERKLREYRKHASVMLVGHEPDFSGIAAHLLGLPRQENIRIRKASLTLLVLESIRAGMARLEFSLPCRLIA